MTQRQASQMQIYTDDSGLIAQASGDFFFGMFFTRHEQMWRGIVKRKKKEVGLSRALHFHKISSKIDDRNFMQIKSIFEALAHYSASWYFRGIHMSRDRLEVGNQVMSSGQLYDAIQRIVARRFLTGVTDKNILLVVEERNRPKGDTYIPLGLARYLDYFQRKQGREQRIEVVARRNSEDDLLQVADCLTAAIRVMYEGTSNPNKNTLSEMLTKPPLKDRISIWEY